VLGPENKAMRKDITLGGIIDGLRVIKSGLEPTDKVIVAGLQKVFFPGAPVKPNEVPMIASPAATSTGGVSIATR
jgi:multidrug efflux system membrane fusion protein